MKFWTNKLFLTLLGWWAFWNEEKRILEAIEKTLKNFEKTKTNLNVKIISYWYRNENIDKLIEKF